MPEELSYLASYLGKDGFFKYYNRFGKLPCLLSNEIIRWKPDIVFISLFAFCYAPDAIEIVTALRKAGYHSKIILGGAGVSAYPAYFLRHSSADFAFAGEADCAIKNIIRKPKSTSGMWYFENEEITHNDPAPVKEFYPLIVPVRKSSGIQYYSGIFTRGCPMRCGFCSSRMHMPGFRKASLYSIKELFQKTDWANPSHLNIEDDAIVWDFEYLLEILNLYKISAGSNATFSLENGIDYRALDADRVKVLAKLGLSKLNISLVSIDPAVSKNYGRTGYPDKFSEVAEAAHLHGISVTGYLIAGLKGDTYDGVRKGLNFLSSLPVLIGISPFYPVPGIQNFEDLSFFNAIPPRLCAGTSCYPWHDISTEELVELFCEARKINLTRREKFRRYV